MATHYNLNGNLIFESSEGDGWVEWIEVEDGSLCCLVGDIKVDKDIDVTILSVAKSKSGEPKYESLEETQRYVESLPKWNKTKYYSRMTEMGSSGLIDCQTGDVIDPGFEYDLYPHLVIKYNNEQKLEPCAICGSKVKRRVPLSLFLVDPTASHIFRSVCNDCAKKYAPILVEMLFEYYSNKVITTQFKIQE